MTPPRVALRPQLWNVSHGYSRVTRQQSASYGLNAESRGALRQERSQAQKTLKAAPASQMMPSIFQVPGCDLIGCRFASTRLNVTCGFMTRAPTDETSATRRPTE